MVFWLHALLLPRRATDPILAFSRLLGVALRVFCRCWSHGPLETVAMGQGGSNPPFQRTAARPAELIR